MKSLHVTFFLVIVLFGYKLKEMPDEAPAGTFTALDCTNTTVSGSFAGGQGSLVPTVLE